MNNNQTLRLALFFLISVLSSQSLQAADINGINTLIEKAQSAGSVRVIVTLQQDKSTEPDAIASMSAEAILKSQASRVQTAVLNQLPVGSFVGEAVRLPYTSQFVANISTEGLLSLQNQPSVVSIQEDKLSHPFLDQSVPYIFSGNNSSLYSGKGFAIAILDTGVDKTHPFLSGKVIAEACYSTNLAVQYSTSSCPAGIESSTAVNSGVSCNPSYRGCEHGTHVAGIAAGYSSNGFHGVAKDADIIAIQVFSLFSASQPACNGNACVLSWTSDQILALQQVYELSEKMSIASVNLSLGAGSVQEYCDFDPRKQSIDLLKSAGIATVISSGNNGYIDAVSSPGCISTAITVGAINNNQDTPAFFSNSGRQLDVYAPGVAINSSLPGGGFRSLSGTSMAAPHVSGAWAVLREEAPLASVDRIESILKNTGVTVTKNAVSAKRINIDASLVSLGFPAQRLTRVLALGDMDKDGSQEIAVIDQGNVLVKKIDSTQVNSFKLSDDLKPTDIDMIQDINNNGAPEIVVLGDSPARAEVIDSLSGALLGAATFSDSYQSVDLEVVPDLNGNQIPELAVLQHLSGSITRVEIRDFLTNVLINTLYFNPLYRPVDLAVLPPSKSSGSIRLAVLQDAADPLLTDRVEIRDALTRKRLRSIWFGKGYEVKQLVVLDDINKNGMPELAVLREGSMEVPVKDSDTGRYIHKVRFKPGFVVDKLLVVSDVNNDGEQELGLMEHHPVSGQMKVELHSVKSGMLISEVWYGNRNQPLDAVMFPDINNNGLIEIGVLGRVFNEQNQLLLQIKDSVTGGHVRSVLF